MEMTAIISMSLFYVLSVVLISRRLRIIYDQNIGLANEVKELSDKISKVRVDNNIIRYGYETNLMSEFLNIHGLEVGSVIELPMYCKDGVPYHDVGDEIIASENDKKVIEDIVSTYGNYRCTFNRVIYASRRDDVEGVYLAIGPRITNPEFTKVRCRHPWSNKTYFFDKREKWRIKEIDLETPYCEIELVDEKPKIRSQIVRKDGFLFYLYENKVRNHLGEEERVEYENSSEYQAIIALNEGTLAVALTMTDRDYQKMVSEMKRNFEKKFEEYLRRK